jgi:hypothetical protein
LTIGFLGIFDKITDFFTMAKQFTELNNIFFTANGAPSPPERKDTEENKKHFKVFMKLFGRKAVGDIRGMPCRVEFVPVPFDDSLYQIFIHLGWMHHHLRESYSKSHWVKLINDFNKRDKKGLWCASFVATKYQSHIVISVKSYVLVPSRFL